MKKLIYMLVCMLGATNWLNGIEIELWHAFDGPLEKAFIEIVEDFNHHSGGQYQIVPVKKGNYKEVFEQGIEAFNSKQQHPHILQVYEVATLTMMHRPDIYVPVGELMSSYHKKFDPDVYIDAVRNFYSTGDGKMLSLPWNASTGILFYNKNAFTKAGLDPEKPPKTWEEMELMGVKLVKSGFKGFTTAWPAAYHLEHLCSWHNMPFATMSNGFEGLDARFIFNGPFQVAHLAKLVEWQKEGIFSYAGRFTNEPEKLFTSGECAILLQGANRLSLLSQQMSSPIGVGFMPFWKKTTAKPYNLNIGGASFWVMQGCSKDEYRGIAQFFEYLSSTAIQAYWHQTTGYLPITEAAYYLTKKKGFYKSHPAAEIAVLEVMACTPTAYTKGVRVGDYVRIRDVIVDQLEKAFSGDLTPQQSLDQAVDRGNLILAEFEKSHS